MGEGDWEVGEGLLPPEVVELLDTLEVRAVLANERASRAEAERDELLTRDGIAELGMESGDRAWDALADERDALRAELVTARREQAEREEYDQQRVDGLAVTLQATEEALEQAEADLAAARTRNTELTEALVAIRADCIGVGPYKIVAMVDAALAGSSLQPEPDRTGVAGVDRVMGRERGTAGRDRRATDPPPTRRRSRRTPTSRRTSDTPRDNSDTVSMDASSVSPPSSSRRDGVQEVKGSEEVFSEPPTWSEPLPPAGAERETPAEPKETT